MYDLNDRVRAKADSGHHESHVVGVSRVSEWPNRAEGRPAYTLVLEDTGEPWFAVEENLEPA